MRSSNKLSNWLQYSGASVVITVNPWHWTWCPHARREHNKEWPLGPNERTYSAGWLFVTVRVWIDNGDW